MFKAYVCIILLMFFSAHKKYAETMYYRVCMHPKGVVEYHSYFVQNLFDVLKGMYDIGSKSKGLLL